VNTTEKTVLRPIQLFSDENEGTFMIHISESSSDRHIVLLGVDGVLDQGSVPVLEETCRQHLKEGKEILLDLAGLLYITREGRKFLREIDGRIGVVNAPEFVKLASRY